MNNKRLNDWMVKLDAELENHTGCAAPSDSYDVDWAEDYYWNDFSPSEAVNDWYLNS